jgi:dihydrofolate reductase
MRKLILFNLTTLDGFFAAADGSLFWHSVDDEFREFAGQQLESVDTIVFGRVTYELMASYWPTEAAIQRDPIVAKHMNEKSKIVCSRALERADWANSTLLKEKVVEEISARKHQPGKDMIVFGSANLAATLAQHGLIDEYRIMLNPIVLGSGIPLFQGVKDRLELRLLRTRVFGSGNVLLVYEPKRLRR